MRKSSLALADTVGIAAAVACGVHCLLGPTLLVLGPVASTLGLGDESFHRGMLWVVMPVAAVAFGIGCRRHHDRLTAMLGAVGLVAFALAATVLHDLIGEMGERTVALGSAGLLVAAHLRNYRKCRSAGCADSCTER